MKPLLPVLTAMLALAACSPEREPASPPDAATPEPVADASAPPAPAASPGAGDETTLTLAGLGGIVIGKPPPASGPAALEPDDVQLSDSCQLWHGARYPKAYVMTDGEVVTRITVAEGSTVRTARGIGPGATEDEVRRAYAPLTSSPHAYVEAPARYLVWQPPGSETGLRFETGADGRVKLIHVGKPPWLNYIEGCA